MTYTGTPTLLNIAREHMLEWSEEETHSYSINHYNIISMIKNNDWFMPIIAQYDKRSPPCLADTSWMGHIKKMIFEGSLYLSLIPCESWAYPDLEKEKNYSIIENAGFIINSPNYTEDAWFSTGEKEIKLTRVYLTDEETPDNPPSIKKKLNGAVEFGTTSIAKTAYNLFTGYTLMRLCYDPTIDGFTPKIAILHNTNPFRFEF